MKAQSILLATLAFVFCDTRSESCTLDIIIDFEGLPGSSCTGCHMQQHREDGFLITSSRSMYDAFVWSRTACSVGLLNNFGNQTTFLRAEDWSPFALASIDLAKWNRFGDPISVTFLGTKDDSTTVSQTFSSINASCFETFELSGFTNVVLVQWVQEKLRLHQFDNIVIDLQNVDCNSNRVDDQCDIGSGTSMDTNGNQTPDECETNCTPLVLGQPSGREVCQYDPVTLSVAASAEPPPTFSWRKNGVGIPGATEREYTVESAGAMDAGVYDVEVSNECGSVISDAAVLVVWPLGTGDVNGDGLLDGSEIGLFVQVLTEGEMGASLERCGGDMNEDGEVSLADLERFVTAVLGQ